MRIKSASIFTKNFIRDTTIFLLKINHYALCQVVVITLYSMIKVFN